ncbi:D-erythrulose 4-kinase [Mycolicibacterium smegmatis]|uniref:D-erythrulose kinase n=2 Tax=Mycolicibacterium smegmatis TaxID=1772 RepID=DERK_MYCS2|nr:D-erythrulose 4-kinase [Mycolicibacterium smegmatis]A0QXE4.1 RecName: Full=D-erythrulose kinase [Mycolicibacterium smegmatis MC2 155]ABK70898.1 dihydroxyacetone kinase [Mycolicibacterium smegmatis MC2 155]AFP39650.1 Putative dihydroxyacetone (Glycerone) kinase protein [Mycolicibacterium smegmatis MC2 155]AIU08418.1 dihydroxyacetone kinase [Mycolicibacterium smegmatis MC2 155]AIU15043.1 dihydroxyacetone kinase [Mycolicibacterium smegmatis]AIU21666.1 dihydroxyacetone kinase [Mycolicibacteriu
MTKLFNDPARFTEDMLVGFLDANSRYVVGVPGGVVRAQTTRPGKVAVVIGGGSGHYPAFCGTVGPGFADGAVVGNIFTSPSAEEAASVARAAHSDAGVLLTTGNYAGDVMNFNLAVDQLRSEGIEAQYFAVTDDVASAERGQEAKRRGIAGDFTVFKCASAAAEEGLDLAGVVRVAEAANAATRTLGVAFDGCTLPGADHPLFTVPEGHMGLGLGIHGEPGVSEEKMPTAAGLAATLVDGVLGDRPDAPEKRIAVILNGLGRTKYEELFVVWGEVSRLLRDRGYTIVEPEVGELVTSLDMAGCSLTVMWLDEELERYWAAPADTPAYKKGAAQQHVSGERRSEATARSASSGPKLAELSDEDGRAGARLVARAFDAMAEALADAEEELGRIDAVAGDGDHGRGMVKGSSAAREAAASALSEGAGQGSVLNAAGKAWAAKAGGTSGVLWGALLTALGARLGDTGRPDSSVIAAGVRDAYDALIRLGGAAPGDKTMLDAMLPFTEELERRVAQDESWQSAWRAAADVATEAARATADLRPKIGRARPLAERSVGTPDAGATSLALCARTVADCVTLSTQGEN